ncbi:hypothetical protein FGO68_gene9782 [Halteria grandinella]|uniref:Uncharacterized protein n=1 Tax=Halteria grandinella TaxID=5974 RepID=A0A8J8NAE0_HALGN|nr:hypothetical protein FGO68_gene9782 [Halteria grandinella]
MKQDGPKNYWLHSNEYTIMLSAFHRSMFVMTLFFTAAIASAAFPNFRNHVMFPFYHLLCMGGAFISFIIHNIMIYKLIWYICPQCGKPFNRLRFDTLVGKTCKHCGLNLYRQTQRYICI